MLNVALTFLHDVGRDYLILTSAMNCHASECLPFPSQQLLPRGQTIFMEAWKEISYCTTQLQPQPMMGVLCAVPC
jgi:hypothetical protein